MQNGRFARNVVERAERLRDSRVAAQHRTERMRAAGLASVRASASATSTALFPSFVPSSSTAMRVSLA